MNKKISLVAVFGLLFLFGCGTQTTPSDTTTAIETPELARQTYQSKTDGYSLKIPADRTFQEKVFGADVMFFSPLVGKDTIKENLGIVKTPLTKSYTLAEYSEMAKSELAKRISGFVEVSDETITL